MVDIAGDPTFDDRGDFVLSFADAAEKRRRATLEKILCPDHPSMVGVKMRLGQDKRGRPVYFEPRFGVRGSETWTLVRTLNEAEQEKLSLFAEGDLEARHGPSNTHIFYWKGDPWS